MQGEESKLEQGQVERAKRLRQKIDELKSGKQIEEPDHEKSIKEQIAERVREIKKKEEQK